MSLLLRESLLGDFGREKLGEDTCLSIFLGHSDGVS